MRITRNPKKPDIFEQNKIQANIGCTKCPNCGETRDYFVCLQNRTSGGISQGIYRNWHEGFLRMKSMRVDCYICHTCGCEWESEPYEWC